MLTTTQIDLFWYLTCAVIAILMTANYKRFYYYIMVTMALGVWCLIEAMFYKQMESYVARFM